MKAKQEMKKLGMIPVNQAQMVHELFLAAIGRVYGDITTAARRGRLTEHDIGLIERRIAAQMAEANEAAGDFDTLQVEVAVASARQQLKDFFDVIRVGRAKDIAGQ